MGLSLHEIMVPVISHGTGIGTFASLTVRLIGCRGTGVHAQWKRTIRWQISHCLVSKPDREDGAERSHATFCLPLGRIREAKLKR